MSGKINFSGNCQLRMGAILSYLAIAINILSALIYSPWMLSQIGTGDYGLYTLATSLINMFLLDFGISSAVSRFVSKYIAEKRQDKVNQLLGVVFKIFAGIACIITIVLIAVYFNIDRIYMSLTLVELQRFKIVYIISATYSVISFPLTTTLNGILNSYEKFIQMKLCDVANKVLTVLLIVIALLGGYGLYALVAINALLNLVCFLAKWIVIKRTTPVNVAFTYWDRSLLKEVFSFSVWVLINSICSRLIMNICPSILGITSGTMAITMFSFASVIEGYSYTFSSAIDGMFMPRIARITYREGNMDKVFDLMIKVGRFQFNLIGLILIGFICVGKDFVTLWIGEVYSPVYYCAILLLLPAPFYLSQQIGKNTMVMLNKIKYLTMVNVIKAVVNVGLVGILSIRLGALGACISICVVYFLRNSANMYLYQTKLGFNTKQFYKKCYGKMSISMLLTLVVGGVIQNVIPTQGWMTLGVKVVVITIVYFILMWIIAYNREEKDMILRAIRKINQHK